MKAAVLEGAERMKLKELPAQPCGPGEVQLRVHACAVCGSDIRIFHHGNPRVKYPAIIGHEVAGEVVDVGEGVKRFRKGDRLALGADVPCGECDWCQNGLGNNCETNYAIGYQFSGGFATEMTLAPMVVNFGPVTAIGEGVSYEEAALAEPLACAVNGLEMCSLKVGETLCVIGAGPIGCMMIPLGRHMGAREVIVIQRSRRRLQLARAFGADHYLCSEETDVAEAVREITRGRGPDVVVTTCGSVEAHEQAIAMVAKRGRVNLFGGLGKGARNLSVPSNAIHYKECFVLGSHGSVPRQHRIAMGLIEKRIVDVSRCITHRFKLEEIHKAFEAAEKHDGLKVMVLP
ncbi:MAG: alcohol dehydrogenase catalytic domain-containing protein [Planctomycetota bacterium]